MSSPIDTGSTELSALKTRVDNLELKSEISWELLMRLNKSHLVKGASHAMIWRAMLKTPRHLPPHHINLLDQLYIELQKKKWLAANPYTKSLRLYERLYNGTTRNEKNLNKKEKVILVNAEKRRNPIKTPVGLSTIHADTLALSTIDQPFLVELNRIYEDTVEECNVTPHKTTAAILSKFVRLLDDHDRPFFGALFLITFGFAYHEIDTQDAEAQQQTLENSGSSNTLCSSLDTTKSKFQKAWIKFSTWNFGRI